MHLRSTLGALALGLLAAAPAFAAGSGVTLTAPDNTYVGTPANPLPTTPSGSTGTSCDATVAAGGTAQALCGGTKPVNGWTVSNPNLSDDLWCSDSSTASVNGQGSVRIAANGGTYETPPLYRPLGAVSCVGPTTGDVITARRW